MTGIFVPDSDVPSWEDGCQDLFSSRSETLSNQKHTANVLKTWFKIAFSSFVSFVYFPKRELPVSEADCAHREREGKEERGKFRNFPFLKVLNAK